MSIPTSTRTAVILCGGKGTRLRPVLGDTPKCLAPVAGRPIVTYILDHLVEQGVQRCVLLASTYVIDRMSGAIDADYRGMRVVFWCNVKPKGTGGDLGALYRDGVLDEEPLLVVNGDSWSLFKLDSLLGFMASSKFKTLVVRSFSNGQFINTGVYLLTKDFLRSIPTDVFIELDECLDAFNDSDKASGMCNYITGKPFLDIGTPERYALAEQFLRGQGVIK